MICSTIIPTIGRPTLSRAVNSVLDQKLGREDFEVIVVNDSGKELPKESWQKSERVRMIRTNRRNRSVARNAGAALALGKYLHFLDDDDWMLPGAFENLLDVAETSKACWVYGAVRLVDNSGDTVTELRPEEHGNCSIQMMAWEWLPLQSSLISAEAFFRIDGFASLSSLLGGFEDVHITRMVSLFYEMARTDQIVAAIRIGEVSSTTNFVDMFNQNRQSRELTLNQANAFSRLRQSALSSSPRSGYWSGKVVYYYLASMKWHLQRRSLSTAASRGGCAIAGLAGAGRLLLASEFWRGVFRPHYARMGIALQEAGADHLYANARREMGLAK